jgi:hypothetical protein
MRSNKHLLYVSFALVFAFVLVQALPSSAQMPGIPKSYGEFKMTEVGSYATYKVIYKNTDAEQIVKHAIVGKEASMAVPVGEEGKTEEPKELYWYERQEINPKTGKVVIAKMLISGNPQEIGTVHRMIFKEGKEPASELPQAFVQLMNQASADSSEAEEPEIQKLGKEKVKIGDKTLECTHLRYGPKNQPTAELWTNDQVPLFGLVKSDVRELSMELIEYGNDAVSGITEEPEQLEMPLGQ